MESAPVAAASGGALVPPPPRFARPRGASDGGTENLAWTVAFEAALKRPALPGNALFLFFDLDDPDALKERQFTALYQASLEPGRALSARLRLSPEEGFRGGHSYRLRVVQLVNGRELVLVEADLSLL